MDYQKYHTTQKVVAHDADCFGRIKAKRLSQMVSDIAGMHTVELHVDRDTLLNDGITWMLYSVHINIDKMPVTGTEMEIDTYPAGIERLFALRCFELKNRVGEMMVRMSSRWMQIDVNKRRPIRPTQAIVELNSGLTMPEHIELRTLDGKMMPKEMKVARQFHATFDNIDFNGHVTQASYMMWMTDSLSMEFHRSHEMVEADVVYEHEIMPETDIEAWIAIEEMDNGNVAVFHKLTSGNGETEHCLGRTVWKNIVAKSQFGAAETI